MKPASKILLFESSLPKEYLSNPKIMKMIRDEIDNMAYEIKSSVAGQRSGKHIVNPEDGKGYFKYIDTSSKSTFPKYLQAIFNNQGTKEKFLKVVKQGRGKVWDRIALEAIDRLENGYQNEHGYDRPNKEFLKLINKKEQDFKIEIDPEYLDIPF
jgi:hypothetical protein